MALRPPELSAPLSTRLNSLPIILAGPILRCVLEDSVTVWIALREPKRVTLEVFALSGGPAKMTSVPTQTVRIGANLHILSLKAQSEFRVLLPNQIYTYNLKFESVAASTPAHGDLFTKGFLVPGNFNDGPAPNAPGLVAYGGLPAPSFAMPPLSINDLKIVHASCRKPHGPSVDAFRVLDQLLAQAPGEPATAAPARDPLKRPHQLYLGGDQIYADDVSSILLALIMDAAPTLLGAPEELPRLKHDDNDGFATEFGPGTRLAVVKHAGFTTSAENHLLAFGEYCAMYLFVWSDVLWPVTLPTHAEVWPGVPEEARSRKVKTLSFVTHEKALPHMENFRRSLVPVRRALANVPTYMIFDDHDVTDDWFINRYFCSRVLKETNRSGRRILQNALMSFAVFQAWGNTPDQHDGFSGLNPPNVGKQLLNDLQTWGTQNFSLVSPALDNAERCVGLPPEFPFANDPSVIEGTKTELGRIPDSLVWDFRQDWPDSDFEVIVLDSRTKRAFPKGESTSPAHISALSLTEQIPGMAFAGTDPLTIVICPQPLISLPAQDFAQEMVKSTEKRLKLDVEVWRFDRVAYEGLLARLADRGSNKKRRVVILSGDVHHAFAWKLQFWARTPAGQEVALAGANVVSSALKNQESLTQNLHRFGVLSRLGPAQATRVSWRLTSEELAGEKRVKKVVEAPDVLYAPFEQDIAVFDNIQPILDNNPGLVFNPPPDTLERRALIRSVLRTPPPVDKVEQPRPGLKERASDALKAVGFHSRVFVDQLFAGQHIVGVNNFGRLRFNWGADEDKSVTQELWWYEEPEEELIEEDPAAPKRAAPRSIMTVPLALLPRPPR